MPTRPLSYVIESRQIGGTLRGFIIVKCAGCTRTAEVQWNGHHNPYLISKHFKRLQWHFDAFRAKNIKCPECNKPAQLAAPTKTPDLSSLGNRIKWTREQIHLSRDQLAEEAQIPSVLLTHIENKTNQQFRIDASAITRLASVLARHGAAVDTEWLNGGERPSLMSVNLRRLMRIHNYTEGSLAAASHVAPSAIRLMLSGNLETHFQIPEIAKTIGCKIEEITGTKEPIPVMRAPPARVLSSVPGPPVPAPVQAPPLPKHVIGRAGRAKRPINTFTDMGLVAAVFGQNPAKGLKKTRLGSGLSQSALASKIFALGGHDWKLASIQSMLSQIERGLLKGSKLLELAAVVFKGPNRKHPRHVNGVSVQPAVSDVSVQPATAIVDPDVLRAELSRATNDLDALKKMLEDLEPIRQMVDETAQKITSITQQLAALPAPEIQYTPITRGDHLQLRGTHWSFRRKVPPEARELFGTNEFFASLKTTDRNEALKLKIPYERAFDAKVLEARNQR